MTDVDYFLALTSLDEINLIASKTAKTLGARKVIADCVVLNLVIRIPF